MIIGPIHSTLPFLGDKLHLARQRIVLVTSANGSKRRSTGFVQHLLRTKLNCNVLTATVTEPSVSGCRDAIELVKRTQANTVIGLGGAAALDVAKFVAYGNESQIITIPCVPCGGKEFLGNAELFDWDAEERIVMVNDNYVPACLLDPQLALDDKIDVKTDCRAFVAGLSIVWNQPDDMLNNNANLVHDLKNAFQVAESQEYPASTQFSPSAREGLFRPGIFTKNEQIARETSFDFMLSNIITSRVPLPRSLVRDALLVPCARARCKASPQFSAFLQSITSSSSDEHAISRLSALVEKTGVLKKGLNSLGHLLDEKGAAVLRGHIKEWIGEAIKAPEYSGLALDETSLQQEIFGEA